MRKLKAFTFCMGRYTEDGYPCVVAVDDEDNPRLASDEKFYIKSEADKVIADLEESHKMEVGQLLMEIVGLKEKHKTEVKELRHHKYKRCRAMAKRCRDVWMLLRHFRRNSEEVVFYWRWWNIWLELAEKFKEDK